MGQILTRGDYQRPTHIDYINRHLVKTVPEFGNLRRLAIEAPPGHGKSQLISIWYPIWRLALNPKHRIGIVSHTFSLAREWGFKTKELVEEYLPELGVEINEESQAAHRWSTKEGGGILCVGIDGALVGARLNCLLIDDPFATSADADSLVNQESVWKWYQRAAYSRMEPGASIVIIHQRWNEGDLIGRLREAHEKGPEAQGFDDYKFLKLPAIAREDDELGRKPGESLWPGRYSGEELTRIKRAMGDYSFSALYQQDPLPEGGGLIKNAYWRYWKPKDAKLSPVMFEGELRETVNLPDSFDVVIQSWDMNHKDSVRAYLAGRKPDAVAGHVWGRKGADYYLLDRFWGRVGLEETIIALEEMTERNPGVVAKLIENTANGPAVMARLEHEIGGFIKVNPQGSKISRIKQAQVAHTDDEKYARAITMLGAVQAGNFYIPHPGYRVWSEDYRNNMGKFPHDGKDDADATSQAWAYLAKGQWKEVKQAKRKKPHKAQTLGEMFAANVHAHSLKKNKNKITPENLYYR